MRELRVALYLLVEHGSQVAIHQIVKAFKGRSSWLQRPRISSSYASSLVYGLTVIFIILLVRLATPK